MLSNGGIFNGGMPAPAELAQEVKFSQCIRVRGIPMADPKTNGMISLGRPNGGPLDPTSPQFQAAQKGMPEVPPAGALTRTGTF